jgi:hypothetical protein
MEHTHSPAHTTHLHITLQCTDSAADITPPPSPPPPLAARHIITARQARRGGGIRFTLRVAMRNRPSHDPSLLLLTSVVGL